MNTEIFTEALRIVACKNVVRSLMAEIAEGGGKGTPQVVKQCAVLLARMSVEEKKLISDLVSIAVDQAVYNTLLVLDGQMVIEDSYDKGKFMLEYIKGPTPVKLNSPGEAILSAAFKSSDSPTTGRRHVLTFDKR